MPVFLHCVGSTVAQSYPTCGCRALFWHKFLVLLSVASAIVHACSYWAEEDWAVGSTYSGEDADKVITGTYVALSFCGAYFKKSAIY
jgi:hypothetical protein